MKIYWIFSFLAVLCAVFASQIDKKIKIKIDKKIFAGISIALFMITLALVIKILQ